MYFLNLAPWTETQGEIPTMRDDGMEEEETIKTFPETRKAVELNESRVIAGDKHSSSVIGIHSIDLTLIRVLWPDAVDL